MGNTPHAELRAWITRSGRTYDETAALLHIQPAYLRHLLSAGRRPSLGLCVRIHDLTGIPPSAWVHTKNSNWPPKKAAVTK